MTLTMKNEINREVTRKCIYSGEILPVSKLVRFNKNKEDLIEIDWNQTKKGRGAYVKKDKDIILEALTKKALSRAYRMNLERSFYEKIIEEVKKYGW